jgi:P-type Ca2+ transporter type 2C
MEKYLRENFDVPAKNPSEAAQRKWRAAVTIVKNRRRRFRMVPDLEKRQQDETKRRSIQVLYCF